MRRVVITGAGSVNALAQDVAGTYAALAEGRSGIGPLALRDQDKLSIGIGAEVKDWQPEAHFPKAALGLYDRFAQFTLKAAAEAVAQSGLSFEGELAAQSGAVFGTAGGGLQTSDETYRAVYAEGKTRVHPLVVPRLMHSAGASHVSLAYGLQGPCFAVSSACASSNHAIGLAVQMIRAGAAKVMLTGGAEAMLCFGGLKAWEGLRVMSPTGCRPFCASRDGMVQGEGAGVFVLEDYEFARARGAVILAEIAGVSMTADASDILMPSCEGASRAITGALRDAGMAASEIGYINAHGTGTAANDRVESAAIRASFGAAADRVMVSSTKAAHGHAIGAAGAIELLACLMALKNGVIAPTLGYRSPDPECPLDIVPNVAREAKVTAVLSNAFAFGGLNAVLALRKV